MNSLYDLGITDSDIKLISETVSNLVDITEDELTKKIEILKLIECSEKQIRHIIISNPEFLIYSDKDVINLIRRLNELGIKHLNLFFESNPYFLNKDTYEIEEYIKQRMSNNYSLVEIINGLEDNPYIIDEI